MNIAGLPASSYTSFQPANSQAGTRAGGQQNGLSQEDQAAIAKLKARDREVRQHEQAHLGASGGLAVSGASFTYQRGPDGVNYAIGGEVSIDTSAGRTPEETLRKAETIRAAALAPADPSGQDRAVAAQAGQMAQEARAELAQQAMNPEKQGGEAVDRKLDAFYQATPNPTPGQQISAYA